ncbi:right-handed parallel beta-helix repeat-containing protein [Motilimonas pumila]|uniref:Bacterial repeat domain-containing protein n=1 Tax=Motilimonas pumila TaxID=2303987 RepID=A0A418YER0_9GAMM|nr:right-handed parallel beta-helix repeat-containing protein [Motilimonas pumila]RJG47674.1 hypothetical protein D1Z90_09680 [Motilimonas pumila]
MKWVWVLSGALFLSACGGNGNTSDSETSLPVTGPTSAPFPSGGPSESDGEGFKINIHLAPTSGGSVTLIPHQEYYQAGEQVYVKVEVNPGYHFIGWSGAEEIVSPLVVDRPLNLTAEFIETEKTIITVANNNELHQGFVTAKQLGGHTTLLLQDGDYQLNRTQVIDTEHITLRSQSGDRDKVRIWGPDNYNMFLVRASHFTIDGVTMGGARGRPSGFVQWHVVQIQGEQNADHFRLTNSKVVDAEEQLIKVSSNGDTPDISADFGHIENNIFEFSTGQAFGWYTGGIDAHRAHHWVIRGNLFRNIHNNNPQPGSNPALTEGAIHFWSESVGSLIENNIIVQCDRGIMLGLDSSGHQHGIIRNNFIVTNKDVGIYLAHASDTQVYNNTVWLDSDYVNAIEYRFERSINNVIVNNLTNGLIRQRNGGQAELEANITEAQAGWFVDYKVGDLHLRQEIESVVDQGIYIEGLWHDIDGQQRPVNGIDIGADER